MLEPPAEDPRESPHALDPDTAAAPEPDDDAADGGAPDAPAKPRQSGVRAVLARLPVFSDLGTSVPDIVHPLIGTIRKHSPKADVRVVLRAYELAERAHGEQKRRSGEPYITHPVGVAEILAELGMDTPTIVAALLHDTVEDTELSLEDIRTEFGDEAAALVDGVTKLDRIKVNSREQQQAESLRKMFVAMASDFRVLLIKLADRLHNMKTIHHLPRPKQERIAEETLAIYAPLAHRLGMQNFKWQLEDLSFQTLHPKRFDEIKAMVQERQPERDRYLDSVVREIDERLRSVKIRGTVTGRPKHYYSIYEKMVMRGKEFDEIYDLVGVRVTVDSVKDCYAALGTLHAMWRPIPGRFKDYIAMPKFNLYQSLHTTVVGPDGKSIEIQIRTKAMHRTAEFGVAAHWKYKEAPKDASRGGGSGDGDAQWLSQMLDWQSDTQDSGEFLQNVKMDLYADEVFVFTPKGDVVALPRGSTPVDFAYAVHTDVGHRCIGARVNERLVALEYELRNGDTVEVLTSKAADAGPSRDWLEFVGSSRARSKIRHWFSRERREDAIEKGREDLQRALAKHGMGHKRAMAGDELRTVAAQMNYTDLDALFRAIGDNHISAATVVTHLQAFLDTDADAEPEESVLLTKLDHSGPRPSEAVVVENTHDVWVTLARCCTPVPGDDILGFVTRGRGVSVHRTDCPNADDLRRDPERIIPVRWDPAAPATFRVTVQVEALDRKHLLRDVTTVLGDLHVNILSAQVATQRDRVATLRFTFELADIHHLDHILGQVRRIDGVYDAYRVVPRPQHH